MLIKDIKDCPYFTAGDNSRLRELLNPEHEAIPIRYSLAEARVKPGGRTIRHRLKSCEVYYIISGSGVMHINNESQPVTTGQAVLIPPGAVQHIENDRTDELVFLCLVDPAWKPEDEEIVD